MFELAIEIGQELLEHPYDHVHHATALRLLERGRIAFLEQHGFPLVWFFERNILLVITRVKIEYLRELTVGNVKVRCEAPELNGRVIAIAQEIRNERNKVAVQANVYSVCMDTETRRGIEPPEELMRLF